MTLNLDVNWDRRRLTLLIVFMPAFCDVSAVYQCCTGNDGLFLIMSLLACFRLINVQQMRSVTGTI